MPKINQEEYEILKELDDKWKWIARDENTHFVNIFEEKPYKDTPIWMWRGKSHVGRIENDRSLFQFIKWEDSEPYSITELIEEYEDSKEYKDILVIEYFMGKAKKARKQK